MYQPPPLACLVAGSPLPPLQVSHSVWPSPPEEFELKAVSNFCSATLLTLQFDPQGPALNAFKQKQRMQRKGTPLKDDARLVPQFTCQC